MSTPILATKLYLPPPRRKIVPRPRLIERLNEGLHGKLTLISAPAGFGKTTLVSEWVSNFRFQILDFGLNPPAEQSLQNPKSKIQNRVAWLSLDEGDSDLSRFLAYLVAALQTIEAQLGAGVMAAIQSPQPPPTEALLTALLNEIATVPDRFVLVLDDYHVIDGASPGGCPQGAPLGAVDQALAFLLDHLPPQMHLVITTREDPQFPLARLRARGQMTEVRAADLRFTATEAARFLNEVMALNLTAADVSALETRTEGWIAGLQLAALSMRGREDVAQFVKAFAGDNRYIMDYLVEEVLQRQPERVRSFLLQTSILDWLSGPLCDAVTGQNDGIARLDALERGNLFVVPLDDQRHWFRYHHLFADVLAAYALQEQPAQVPLLHQRASEWYAANDLPADAIRHALAAKDFARAAGLVERAWPEMDGRFQSATWLGWAKAIPDEMVRVRPVLNLAYAWALLNGGDLEAAEARLRDTERLLEGSVGSDEMVITDEVQFRTLPASMATALSYLTQARGDLPGSLQYGRRALDLLPAEDHLRRGPAAALLGLAYWANGDLDDAYLALADAMAGFQKVGSIHFAISATYGLGDIRTAQGRLRDAIRVYAQVLQLALAQHPEGSRPPLRGTADLYLGLAELHRELGDADAAHRNLRQSDKLGEPAGLSDWRYRFCRAEARFRQGEGDLAGALDRLDEAERHTRPTPVPDLRPLAAMRARVWVAQGRLAEARRWAQEQGLSIDDPLSYLREFEHITLARLLLAESQRDRDERVALDAMSLLERLRHAAEAGGRMGSVIEIGVLQALAHQAQGNLDSALEVLERVLWLAEPEGYVRIFVDEGLPMAELLSVAAAQGIMPDYIGKLLGAFEASTNDEGQITEPAPPSIAPGVRPRPSPLVEPLSERELEVLNLIAQGLSNQEISERLFLALSSVKGHNQNIFGKLQVQRRTEAVARARELGLV
jgi:LuxR family maltose regulon positive regulatory protein